MHSAQVAVEHRTPPRRTAVRGRGKTRLSDAQIAVEVAERRSPFRPPGSTTLMTGSGRGHPGTRPNTPTRSGRGGVITSAKPGEFAVATDYDDARRRRHRRFGVVGRWRMTRTVGVIAVVAVVAVVVVGGVHAVVVGGVLFAEEGRQAGPIDSSHPSPP